MCERHRQTDKQKDRETVIFLKENPFENVICKMLAIFFSGLMPQSHPTTGPARFLPPVRFLPVRPSDTSVGILRQCCSRGHIRLRPPCGLTRLYTYYGLVEWFAGLHGYPVRCTCGHRTGPARESSMFFISYGIRTGPYGEAKFVRRRTGPVRAPWVDVRFLFKTAREQPVRGPAVWCDWGINIGLFDAYFSSRCIVDFDPNWAFPDCNSSLNSPLAMKWCTKVEAA